MKRWIALSAALLLLLGALSGCGDGGSGSGQDSGGSKPGQSDSAVLPGDTAKPQTPEEPKQETPDSALPEDEASPDRDGGSRQETGGVPLEEMLENARVHDRDGDLLDGENAVTPGTARW